MESLIKYRPEIESLCRTFNVSVLYVFGSSIEKKRNLQSDINFVVAFGDVTLDDYADNYFDLCETLEKLLTRKVNMVVETSIKNPYFKEEVDETKRLLFAA